MLVGVTLVEACDCIIRGERGIALAPDTGGLVLSPFEAACLEVLNVLRSCLCMNIGSHETYKCFKFSELFSLALV